jgi:hypothetical protein
MTEFVQPETAWCMAGDQVIFLDLRHDRYFRLDEASQQEWLAGFDHGQPPTWFQPQALARPDDWQNPVAMSRTLRDPKFSLARVAQSLWVQRRVEARLASQPFLAVLEDLRRLIDGRTRPGAPLSARGQALVAGFEYARLLRSAVDRCLPRSIALAGSLAACGDRSHLVIGVTIAPFAAHSWVQHGETVLNDSLAEVQRYEPILVV